MWDCEISIVVKRSEVKNGVVGQESKPSETNSEEKNNLGNSGRR